jgi:hypothetical protein
MNSIQPEQISILKEKLDKFVHSITSDSEIDSYDWQTIYQLVDNYESSKPTEQQVESMIRAFWRRIDMYKNDYDTELPEDLPIAFKTSMYTALMCLDISDA